ncbi:hypothetical protein GH733_016035 [Mirounga leonina]|nr:hypothetical protein GH733_016035 [Mirounga leonina]
MLYLEGNSFLHQRTPSWLQSLWNCPLDTQSLSATAAKPGPCDCDMGFYAEDSTCEQCSSPCKTCEGNATNCHSCQGSLILHQGACREACPERHVAVEGVCKHCPEMCQDCIHEKTCKECMPGSFLYQDMCHPSCPHGFYVDIRKCVPCHKDCLECSGPSADDCDLCAEPSLVLYDGQCLDECPVGTYYEKETKDCRDCHKSCQTCSSPGICTACQEGLLVNHHGDCVPHKECAPVEYWDVEALGCKPCHAKCFRCTGPAEDQCHTCQRDNLLFNRTCVQDCPEGYYADEDSHQCVPCHSSCRTCEGRHSTQCLSCQPGLLQLEKECLLQCLEGYYAEISTGRCKRCSKSCKACRGPQPTDCLSCDSFFFLLRSKGECHRNCPEHYYAEQGTQTCERCHPTCDKCKAHHEGDNQRGPPRLKQQGKSMSSRWGRERLKAMVHNHQFSTLWISKGTTDFIYSEGKVGKNLVTSFLACLHGKVIKLGGFWSPQGDSFFHDTKEENEMLPRERPDTSHLEQLPCTFQPSKEVLVKVLERCGEMENMDIPTLDPQQEEMTGQNFHTFRFGDT